MARASSSERRETQGNIPRFPDFKRWKMVKVHENPTSWVTQVIYLQQTECKQLYYTDYTVESLGLTNFDLVVKKDDFGHSDSHLALKWPNSWWSNHTLPPSLRTPDMDWYDVNCARTL